MLYVFFLLDIPMPYVFFLLDIPMPYAANLEALATPQVQDIVDICVKSCARPFA
jgi:pyruvate/2-oxoglutarate/acetoin dehydrogenase E1 component